MFMAKVVYAAMLSDAGKRIGVSILRADDLSDDLCSNRYGSVSGSGDPGNNTLQTLNWKLKTGGNFRMLRRLTDSWMTG
jgi:hypothetical protein